MKKCHVSITVDFSFIKKVNYKILSKIIPNAKQSKFNMNLIQNSFSVLPRLNHINELRPL